MKMPNIFVKADCEILVELPEVGWVSDQWKSQENEQICEEYGHPKCTINFRIENPNDPICPVIIHVGANQAIDGGISVKAQSETRYMFTIQGTFKSKIHKDGIPLLDAGQKPMLEGVTRFRHGYNFDEPRPTVCEFSLKKFK
jgi:hypothetical protein